MTNYRILKNRNSLEYVKFPRELQNQNYSKIRVYQSKEWHKNPKQKKIFLFSLLARHPNRRFIFSHFPFHSNMAHLHTSSPLSRHVILQSEHKPPEKPSESTTADKGARYALNVSIKSSWLSNRSSSFEMLLLLLLLSSLKRIRHLESSFSLSLQTLDWSTSWLLYEL